MIDVVRRLLTCGERAGVFLLSLRSNYRKILLSKGPDTSSEL
jgi:hypothetical protein